MAGSFLAPPIFVVITLISRFLTYLRHELNRATLTVEAYGRDLTQFQDWMEMSNSGNPIDFTLVSSGDIRAWLTHQGKQGDSPRTLRRKVISLRALFKWMMKSGLIENSPLRDLALPKIPKPLPDFVKPEEVETAIKSISNNGIDSMQEKSVTESEQSDSEAASLRTRLDKLVVEMLYTLGIRRAELININDADISFDKGEIKVTGKRSKQRVVPVPQQLLAQIKAWQNCRDSQDNTQEGEMPLFLVKGKRIRPEMVYRIVHKALESTSARKKSPHALRHSFASGMLNGGAEIDSVREFLGHASLATTQIYTHVSINEIKKAYRAAHPRSQSQGSGDKD